MRILYVEDQPDTAHALQKLLQRYGHEVDVAQTAADAKKIYAQSVYDLLLIDLELPDGHGGNLLRTLKRMSEAKAIAFSGYCSSNDIAECEDDGFDGYLAKPASLEQILNAIASLN